MTKRYKILVIDDSETNLYLIKSIFRDQKNISVFSESESSHALKVVKKIRPDIILLDLMMPEIDGFELLNQLKSNINFQNIPVIILSAYHDNVLINRATELGAAGYIKKPVDIVEIKNLIIQLLNEISINP